MQIDGNRRLLSGDFEESVWENPSFLLTGIIAVATILFAAGSFIEPLWTGILFILSLMVVWFFLRLKIAILLTLFIYIVSYRVIFQLQTTTKVFVEIIHVSSYAIVMITYFIWVLRRVSGIQQHKIHNYLNTAVILFICWGACTLFWTDDIMHGLVLLFAMLVNLIIINFFLVYFEEKKDFDRFMRFVVIAGFLLGLITFISKWYLYEYKYDIPGTNWTFIAALGYDNYGQNTDKVRAAGFATANQAAFMLNVFVFLILSMNFDAKLYKEKFIYIVLFFFLSGCVVLSGSKGGMISLFCGLCLVLSMNIMIRLKRTRWFIIIAGLFIIAFIIVYYLGENRVVGSVSGGKSGQMAYLSFSTRLKAWHNAFNHFDNFATVLFGYGIGSSAQKAKILPNIHNFYLAAMFDLGLIGLFLYLNIILTIILTLYKRIVSIHSMRLKNILYCLAGAMAASMINGLIFAEFEFHFFWILLAIIAGFTCKAFIYKQDELALNTR